MFQAKPHKKKTVRERLTPLFVSCLSMGIATSAWAQAAPAPTPQTPPAQSTGASSNTTINLINLLVQRGILSQAQASDLIKEAQQEAATARSGAPAPAAAGAAAGGAAASAAAPPSDGAMHVQYVPESVKAQLRDEIKQEVLQQAQQENWAAPNEVPDWVKRLNLSGDIRLRYEHDSFPSGNATSLESNDAVNFNAINTGSPFLIGGSNPPPSFDVDKDRNRFRLRARLGVDADLGEGFSSGMRVATGETDSPVTENQTLGVANNVQGGNFSRYAIWLDRAWVRYDAFKDDRKNLALTLGRFDNPFFATNLLWADDLGFDGGALTGKYAVTDKVTPFFTVGAFPVFNTDLNFASAQPAKFPSEDKWLYAAQVGTDWKATKELGVKLAGAYYFFDNIQGKVSDCAVVTASDSCPTDDSRPAFAQRGNTYMALRNITNLGAGGADYEFFGLSSPFHVLALTSRLDYNHFDPIHLILDGEFIKNLAFDKNLIINRGAASNPGPFNNVANGVFNGGDTGYFVNATVGKPILEARWDWNASLGYKYIESDAMVDGFTDSDFGLGGTNLKGYIVGGNLALAKNVWTRLRWLSADNISGAPFGVDVLQLDLNVKF